MHVAHTRSPHATKPPPDQAPAIVARDLVKTYPGGRGKPPVTALDRLSLDVPAGRVLGLLGPNGAGKSTTVKILATLSRADAGTAQVAGIDVRRSPDAVRRRIGLVSQGASSDPIATGRENLVLAALLHGRHRQEARTRADELLHRFGLAEAADRAVRTYSGGMSRRLDVAIGLVHRPSVLFLDEPTTGLDPQARAEMWAEIARLSADEAITVLLTTHYLDEADHLADTVAIVDRGRIVAQGSPEALKSELRGDTVALELDDAAHAVRAADLLAHVAGLRDLVVEGASLRARADLGARAVPVVLAVLDEHGVTVGSVTVARPSLDDVYLRHAGRVFEGGRA